MKKINILFALLSLVTASLPLAAQQRYADIKAGFYDFADTIVVGNGNALELLPSITNLGADTVMASDTIFVFGNAIGVPESNPMPLPLSGGIIPSYISLITFQGYEYLTNNRLASSDSTFELCFGAYPRNGFDPQASIPLKDTLLGNNKKCIQVTFKGKTVGIEDQGQNIPTQVKIYPNPAYDRVSIEWTAIAGNTTIRLLDLGGRPLKTTHLGKANTGKQKTSLELTGLAPGLYIIEIQNGHRKLNQKLSIK